MSTRHRKAIEARWSRTTPDERKQAVAAATEARRAKAAERRAAREAENPTVPKHLVDLVAEVAEEHPELSIHDQIAQADMLFRQWLKSVEQGDD